jgi:hypothetical protein
MIKFTFTINNLMIYQLIYIFDIFFNSCCVKYIYHLFILQLINLIKLEKTTILSPSYFVLKIKMGLN